MQQKGWYPVGIAKRLNNCKVNAGDFYNDCVFIIAKEENGTMIPVSDAFKVLKDGYIEKLITKVNQRQTLHLYRKYNLSSRWINRWGNMLGTIIETSDDPIFKIGNQKLWTCSTMPTELINISLNSNIKNFIRIFPAKDTYPVIAEIRLQDTNGDYISNNDYTIFAIGKGLTGDTLVVKSLTDGRESTTFYKQFPFWIGVDIRKCKHNVANLHIIQRNDMNRIMKHHNYELFYYNKQWISLGKKRAVSNSLIYNNVPSGCIYLLRDYTSGKEERIFEYKNNKQIWW